MSPGPVIRRAAGPPVGDADRPGERVLLIIIIKRTATPSWFASRAAPESGCEQGAGTRTSARNRESWAETGFFGTPG
jgi:hypothetical protein